MNKSAESGNIFFYILLAIVLFAALSYVASQGNRGNTSTLTDQQAKLAAQEIIEYGQTVANAVQKLRLRGCTDTQISFENDVVSGYGNVNAPTDNSCHVFKIEGGGLNWANPPPAFYNETAPWFSGKYFFYGETVWAENGTTCANSTCADLIMGLHVSDSFCEIFNDSLGLDMDIEDTTWGGGRWTGTYGYFETFADETDSAEAAGKTLICSGSGTSTNFGILQLLIAR